MKPFAFLACLLPLLTSACVADRDQPFVNSLGMKFVPVPGTKVLMSIWETRVQDYAAYAAAKAGVDAEWKDGSYDGHQQGPDHPVVNVNWEDAKAFCAWLSRKEGKTYRLPTDHEWSVAVGIGGRESASASPEDKDGKIKDVYPWGNQWPPPRGAGNYDSDLDCDDFATTAPVGSFSANRFGLYDLGGNVWEWCADWYDSSQKNRVLRGGSWYGITEKIGLRSSLRLSDTPTSRSVIDGFRVVLEVGSGG
jgi:formylglycine-generating enzyme required for sulfatase activity